MPGVKLKLRVKVESGRVPKICKSGAAEHFGPEHLSLYSTPVIHS